MNGAASGRSAGFSLIEVMVALIVLSVGLLGIARMQSVALSSTTVANKRSLAALQAASLAAMMHENRGYWTTGDPSGATITITGTTFSISGGAAALNGAGTPDCSSAGAPCTPVQIAAYDLQQWATAVQSVLPNDVVTIKCGTLTPVSCTALLQWSENVANLNAQSAGQASTSTASMQVPDYTLYIEP